jgi:hypothetical protein
MEKLIATDIETKDWYSIIELLKKDGWKVITEYNQFDKGIDFDLYELTLNGENIVFAWDNWFEGEIKCSEQRMRSLETTFRIKFKFGKPEHLSHNLIDKMKSLLIKK